ncbi:hypothetical protein QCA50_018528 [Cerrena zonata]|uniref:Uncharacterized protein n=1 Tax=Cerrena zonata TaxID=2478898 RepID=A0AAW0FLK2_9APHY
MIITDYRRNKFTLTMSDNRKYKESVPEGCSPNDNEAFAERHVYIPLLDVPRFTFSVRSALNAREHYKVVIAAHSEDVETYVISSGDDASEPFTFGERLITYLKYHEVFIFGSMTLPTKVQRGNRPTISVVSVKVYRLVFAKLYPTPSPRPMSEKTFNRQVDGSRPLEDQLELEHGVVAHALDEHDAPYVTFRFYCFLPRS